ncbi:hypothetical protein GCM10009557_00730 [Virgisporangium ochraceum]|uniref:Thiamine pyrophosphate enzyme TPP-binding domain-containing protein n=1 Tax=Virgisporangium ochraceum TaxID=65505 RepID=A0A8J4A692_9ACTN|nr:hypothetical protein Voc01_090220 [Virgisporangium ochraceum]
MTAQDASQRRDRALLLIGDAIKNAGAALIVGNGDLSRRVGNLLEDVPAILLEGAMGMSAAVAVGFNRFSNLPTVVIEGDGNRILGSPAAEWLATSNLKVLHVVFANHMHASSGGQPVALDLSLTGPSVYRVEIHDLAGIADVLSLWSEGTLPVQLTITETVDSLDLPPRPQRSIESQANALQQYTLGLR